MERLKIVEQLTGIFREIFNDNAIVLSDSLTADDVATWDSLSHMLLITEIEDQFNIKFKLRELNKMKNVGALISIIQTKLN